MMVFASGLGETNLAMTNGCVTVIYSYLSSCSCEISPKWVAISLANLLGKDRPLGNKGPRDFKIMLDDSGARKRRNLVCSRSHGRRTVKHPPDW